MKTAARLLALSLFLSACAVDPVSPVPGQDFSGLAPIALNVGRIEVSGAYSPPSRAPNVDHLFPTPPVEAARQVLSHALAARGSGTVLRAVVEDASVVSVPLPGGQGLAGKLRDEPSERLEARLAVRFTRADDAAPEIPTGNAEVVVTRNRTILSSASPAGREAEQARLTADLMKDLESGLATTVRKTFGLQ